MTARDVILAVWAGLALLVVAAAVLARVSNGAFPGTGSLVNTVTRNRGSQVVVILLWMWVGWHAFAR